MRKQFDELVETMKRWDLYFKGDEVDCALNDLESAIDEVEKRIECAVQSADEINSLISEYTERVDKKESFVMSVNTHDEIQRCSNDVTIALDLNEDMCIKDNWYNLFSPKEEPKPIAVGDIEYDFPEEVYTIGNADNTEIIGDVYESVFIKLLEGKVIFTENDKGFTSGKTNYVITHEQFIPLIKFHQIDLSNVPIKQDEFASFESSWGIITCAKDGVVISVDGDLEINGERNYLFDIAKFDLEEYGKFCESRNITMGEADDILAVGFWRKDNTYNAPDFEWRNSIFGDADVELLKARFEAYTDEELQLFNGDNEETLKNWNREDAIQEAIDSLVQEKSDEVVPSSQCKNTETFDKVKQVIEMLKTLDNGNCVDGETMSHIVSELGFDEFLLKHLIMSRSNIEINDILTEKKELNGY